MIDTVTIDFLIEKYDVLLFDAYGVLVDARTALPGAASLVQRLNQHGKPYYILSNDAAKTPQTALKRYRNFGLEIKEGAVLTSGCMLKPFFKKHGLFGAKCAVMGPEDSTLFVQQAGGEVVGFNESFEVLVVADESGYPLLETLDQVISSLFQYIDAGGRPTLILPNPDLIYPKHGKGFGLAAGSLASMIENVLKLRYPQSPKLQFHRLGKPYQDMFKTVMTQAGTENAVMVGDQLVTDICGANRSGLDSALVLSGVSRLEEISARDEACYTPTYILRDLL